MNFQDIRAFVAVAEAGSINRAAARLNLTQPATTRRIQNFEAAMGPTPLFNRAVKPAVLTTLGHQVLEHCREVLAAVAELESCAANATDPAGDLRAGIAHGLGEIVLTSPLDALRRAFPRIRLQIGSNWTTDLIEEVRGGALDCAIGLMTDAHAVPTGVQRVPLGLERVVVVSASRASKKSDGKPWRLRDLAGDGWVLNPSGCGCRAALLKSLDGLQLPVRIAAEIFGEDLQMAILAQSGGLGLVPRRQFERSPHRRSLKIVEVSDFSLSAMVTLIRKTMPGRFEPAIALLAGELKAKLAKQKK